MPKKRHWVRREWKLVMICMVVLVYGGALVLVAAGVAEEWFGLFTANVVAVAAIQWGRWNRRKP